MQGNGELARKVGVGTSRDRVWQYVIAAADNMKQVLKKELANKFVYLKFDCATRIRTNYLGVNACSINSKNEAETRTLMIMDTKSQHSSKDLKVLLLKVQDDLFL